ncbi:F-box/kelch-repeat protein SKIP30-like [Phragmites australis]|uniref:F-box/kelch-repeat protein SKIP30-like n=1 Tax=Phragmites australis TaxID=29695 RepID=UPI002D76CF5D|nr:F-box/kelch-repeat protein SKIP30-like [Phragmites australis]XP_062205470.1 F-box/kelch-repeat protein SKIP30-like [Phragmites australis]
MIQSTMASTLLDGLPNEVALQCLARVPFLFHPKLQLVCCSWRASVCSGELLKVRNQIGVTEELLCVLAFEPENMWQLYDPLRDKWITLPVMPSQIRNIARFGVASVAGKLYVIGGGSDRVDPLTGDHDRIFASNEVWSFDPLNRVWAQRAPMLVARAMFACCALDGKIIVAGGFTNCRKSISKAEIYDPEADAWEPLPDLRQAHSSACSGLVIKGKMHVLHKGLPTVQILEDGGSYWAVEDFSWLQGPMAMVSGELYVLSNSCIMKQRGENFPDKMVSCASEFQSRIGFGMIGLGNSIYLVGGVIGPGPRNQCIKPLSDVDILNVTSERPTWRPGSPMTHCRGSISGCALLRI